MKYLLGITVGPVQTYIEESRKLLDLHNSSRIISDIMKKIINFVRQEDNDVEMIYPNDQYIDDSMDFSNYAVLEISKIIDVGNIENKICSCFNKKYSLDINEVLYIFWAIEEIDNKKYYDCYKELTRYIRSLKNTYDFKQNEQTGGKKCLICGKHNICTSESTDKYRLNTAEELCPLCLAKRKYSKNKFDSVYSLAIKKWKQKNEDNLLGITTELDEIFKNKDKYYNKAIIDSIIAMVEQNNDYGKSKKYKEIKDDLKNSENDLINYIDKFKNIKRNMDKLYFNNKTQNGKIKNPNYEYCLIQFDVDDLGKWMSGKYFDNEENLKKYQKNISENLVRFGKKLRKKLDAKCDVIYSGGDDFLGVLSNEDIVGVVKDINNLFELEVQNKIKEEYKKINHEMTYSMSITIAQCKDPMSYALSKTRIELENVKKRYDCDNISKNGVAVNYIINNGKEITCYFKKNKLMMLCEILKGFNDVKELVSFSYINNFENEMLKFNFKYITFEQMQNFCEIANLEFKRLILRSKMNIKENDSDEYINRVINFTYNIIYENCIEIKSNEEVIDFKNIVNILKINEKLSRLYLN